MRILHTSDWHLGRKLEGRDRSEEQVAFVNEICEIVEREGVHLVLLAGDVFDSVNPPAVAEALFYEALDRLSVKGQVAVVVIAGNHDNPLRLRAANPLADHAGISLVGLPLEVLQASQGKDRAYRINTGESWMEIVLPGIEHHAVVVALPYPSEATLKEALTEDLDEKTMQMAYSQRIARLFHDVSTHFRPDTVNLVMSHLFVRGGEESESERPIQLGGACSVEPSVFPEHAHYVALGHLHRPQTVSGTKAPTRYSGSPLAYSFSEVGHQKSVILADAIPGQSVKIHKIPLASGRPLVCWKAREGISQVIAWGNEDKDKDAWIDLEIHIAGALSTEEIQLLRKLRPGFIHIRAIFPEQEKHVALQNRSRLPIEELFKRFFQKKNNFEPDDALIKLFLELIESREALAGQEMETVEE